MSMYYIDISGQFSIDQITQAMQDEENLFSEFKDSTVITADDLSVLNHARFAECDTRPIKPVIVLLEGSTAPAGTSRFWNGTMVIGGTSRTVAAFR